MSGFIGVSDDILNLIRTSIAAPYVHVQRSTLGGMENASIIITVSLDDKKDWYNDILQNSRYFMIHLGAYGTMEQFSKHYQIKKKFRKTVALSVDEGIAKINKYISEISTNSNPRGTGKPLSQFCCSQPHLDNRRHCAPKRLLEEGQFEARMSWLRHHMKRYHPDKFAASIKKGVTTRKANRNKLVMVKVPWYKRPLLAVMNPTMRMEPKHYDILRERINKLLDAHPEVDVKKVIESMRMRWDIYWAAGSFSNAQEYAYLNDNHIDTALKSILKDRYARKGNPTKDWHESQYASMVSSARRSHKRNDKVSYQSRAYEEWIALQQYGKKNPVGMYFGTDGVYKSIKGTFVIFARNRNLAWQKIRNLELSYKSKGSFGYDTNIQPIWSGMTFAVDLIEKKQSKYYFHPAKDIYFFED